jgi:hypothetical protein
MIGPMETFIQQLRKALAPHELFPNRARDDERIASCSYALNQLEYLIKLSTDKQDCIEDATRYMMNLAQTLGNLQETLVQSVMKTVYYLTEELFHYRTVSKELAQ